MVDIATGDIVHIRAKVVSGFSSPLAMLVKVGDAQAFYVTRTAIIRVEPRALQVGDLVTWQRQKINYSILAIAHDRAWLKLADADGYDTIRLCELKLVARTPNTTNTKREG